MHLFIYILVTLEGVLKLACHDHAILNTLDGIGEDERVVLVRYMKMTVSWCLRYQLLSCNVVSQLDAAWYPKEKVQQAKKKLVTTTQGEPSTKEG